MRGFFYVVSRDYGFAPNPFGGLCTLATCKPRIRKAAKIGDWVFGIGSRKKPDLRFMCVYAMLVEEILSFNDYWNDPKYQFKKPSTNGSRKSMWGDNIYYQSSDGVWNQADSHHSLEDGHVNDRNLEQDTALTDRVLISSHFYYFGKSLVLVPSEYTVGITQKTNGEGNYFREMSRKIPESQVQSIVTWILSNYAPGYHDDPAGFEKHKLNL